MKSVLIVIAEKDFQDNEYSATKNAIEKAGIKVTVASKTKGVKRGVFGGEVNAMISFDEVNESDFDAIVFIGGGGAQEYIKDAGAKDLVQKFFMTQKIVAAVCIAPLILASSGTLNGKKATVWDDGERTQIDFLERFGGEFIDEGVVVDGRIITANGPKASQKFGEKIGEELS